MPTRRPATRSSSKFASHFHEVFEQVDRSVKALFDEAVADGEDVEKFVYAKLKLRCYEIFKTFDRDNQTELLVDDRRADLRRRRRSIRAEQKFRNELEALLDNPTPIDDADIEIVQPATRSRSTDPTAVTPRSTTTRSSRAFEHHYSADPAIGSRSRSRPTSTS